MRIESAAATIRPRGWWEAADLGFAMTRTWRKAIWGAWLATFVPVCLLAVLLSRFGSGWAWLVVWWFKPLYDAAVLHVLSRALFGEVPTTGSVLAALPGALRRVGLPFLTWRRLSPGRSFVAPVFQLEGLATEARGARLRVVTRDGYAESVRLLAVCQCFEVAIALSLFGLAVLLHPSADVEAGLESWAAGGFAVPPWLEWVTTLASFAAMTAVEPFYVAGGFALYLNRRTRLEAWDIELSFRRLGRRLAASAAALALAVVLVGEARGDQRADPAAGPDPARTIRAVLDDPAFGTKRAVRGWRFRQTPDAGRWDPTLGLSAGLGAIVEPVVWAAALGAASWIAWLVVRETRLRRRQARGPSAAPAPAAMFGLDIRPESLPDDPAATARELWSRGRATEALGLLYRAALARLAAEGEVELRGSATEGDCVRLVAAVAPPSRAGFFRALTESWQFAAYGHRAPGDAAAEFLVAGWLEHFGGGR